MSEPKYRYYEYEGFYFRLRLTDLGVFRLKDGIWQPDPFERARDLSLNARELTDPEVTALGLADRPSGPEYRYYEYCGFYFRLRLTDLNVWRLKDGSWEPDPTTDLWDLEVDSHLLSDQMVTDLRLPGTQSPP